MNRTGTSARRTRLWLAAIALVLLALHALAMHPHVLLLLFAVELAAITFIAAGCWRASGIGHRHRTQRWVAWTL